MKNVGRKTDPNRSGLILSITDSGSGVTNDYEGRKEGVNRKQQETRCK